MQEELRRRLDRIEGALLLLPELKIRMEYLPDSVAERVDALSTWGDSASNVEPPMVEPSEKAYQPERKDSWNWKEHILFTLFHKDRPMLSAELVDILHELGVRGRKAFL